MVGQDRGESDQENKTLGLTFCRAIGAVAVTVPTCWWLWPSASHAEAHHEHHQPDTKEERSDALTHEADEKEPVETKEVATPEGKGETDDVQFKGKTSDGDENNKQDDTRKVEDDGKGGKKLRIDSAAGKDLGAGAARRDDGSESVRLPPSTISSHLNLRKC